MRGDQQIQEGVFLHHVGQLIQDRHGVFADHKLVQVVIHDIDIHRQLIWYRHQSVVSLHRVALKSLGRDALVRQWKIAGLGDRDSKVALRLQLSGQLTLGVSCRRCHDPLSLVPESGQVTLCDDLSVAIEHPG